MTTSPLRLPRLFTVEQAADELVLSSKTIRRAIACGDLPVHRIGRLIRIAEPDLVAFFNKKRG
jgi:excisionase family DNA binding protein